MTHHEVLMYAPPFERALTVDVSTQKPAAEVFGRLGETIRARDAGTARHFVYRTCSQCRGQIGRLCVICGGNGSIRVVVEPDEILDRDARAFCAAVKGDGR